MEVGFVGLGGMGSGMARNLARAGHRVTAWNRTRARAEALAGDGVAVAACPAEAARAGVVLTMVADDAALDAVSGGPEGLLAGLPAGGLHVCSSTVGVETAERHDRAHQARGQSFVAAPVFGRPDAAAAGKLAVVAAGPPAAVERARPLLQALGPKLFVVGAEPAQATLVKLTGNFLITVVIEALSEANALAAKGGIDPARLLEVLVGTLFDAPVYRTYGQLLLEERFSPAGFPLPLGAKDNRLALAAAERLRVPLPLASLVRDRMLAALARGWDGLDWSVISRLAREGAGLPESG
jgi:3-hydroxyisobutyrate dehydrogenase-like beta-hydroxyacid dehydrogenase